MKIIVMDSANVRIEFLNVPDHMLEEEFPTTCWKRTSRCSWQNTAIH